MIFLYLLKNLFIVIIGLLISLFILFIYDYLNIIDITIYDFLLPFLDERYKNIIFTLFIFIIIYFIPNFLKTSSATLYVAPFATSNPTIKSSLIFCCKLS